VPLPELGLDETSATIGRRVSNDNAGMLRLERDGAAVLMTTTEGHRLMMANELAFDALEVIVRTGALYVRELPGDRLDEEKVALVAALARNYLLRVGS
jgi:hypothetical protein